MQQRLMLRGRPLTSRNRRDWLDALVLAWHHQADAIVTQRSGAIIWRPVSASQRRSVNLAK
jgi:gluconate kinase